MKIGEIKKKMLAFRDLNGQDLLGRDKINEAKDKKELQKILDSHITHIEMTAIDVAASVEQLKQDLGLHLI